MHMKENPLCQGGGSFRLQTHTGEVLAPLPKHGHDMKQVNQEEVSMPVAGGGGKITGA